MFGLLNLNKPAGWTSRDVVNRVVRCTPRKTKVGHAGTLDPLATGVLVVCVGPATRLVPLIHDHSKTYEAGFQLGLQSDTDDIEGETTEVPIPSTVTQETVESLLPHFLGRILQVPPAYSAIKVNGVRSYKAARQGELIQHEPRPVQIDELELTQFDFPHFTLRIRCGTGTYVRSIGRDLGQLLGTGVVMTELVRTEIGEMKVEEALSVESLTRENLEQALQSPLTMLDHLPTLNITSRGVQILEWGQSLPVPKDLSDPEMTGSEVALVDENQRLAAIGILKPEAIIPHIVFRRDQNAVES